MVTAATQVLNDGGRPVTKRVRVTNRRGRPVDIGLTVAALPEADGEAVAGVILMMEEANDTGAAGDKKA